VVPSLSKSTPNALDVAKVGRSQAIIVALITTVGGSIGGYLLAGGPLKPPSQHWLVLDRVEGAEHLSIRIVANVDGINYSYPSKAIWAEIGPTMAGEKFPLPLSTGEYKISFSAFYLNEQKIPGLLGSNELFNKYMPPGSSTQNMEYRLFEVSEAVARAPTAKVRVIYRVE
jgi:hypothetical protein